MSKKMKLDGERVNTQMNTHEARKYIAENPDAEFLPYPQLGENSALRLTAEYYKRCGSDISHHSDSECAAVIADMERDCHQLIESCRVDHEVSQHLTQSGHTEIIPIREDDVTWILEGES